MTPDLARLRAWLAPLVGEVSEQRLLDLRDILEEFAGEVRVVPGYRREDG